jgi:hypothetical protein
MSDALLTEISKKLSDIHAALKGGSQSGGAASSGAKTPPPADDAKKVAADKAVAKAKAEAKAKVEAAAAGKTTAAAGTKAPGGKHTVDQVRAIIRKVAEDIDKPSAKDILKDDGGGAERVADLKPQFYDAVFEACEVLRGGEGKPAAATAEPEDDLM